jgi:hypothetical protein
MSISAADKVKIWLFPSVMSLLAALIWHDVSEIRSDVKLLMAQSSIDKTKIDNLERIVYGSKITTFLDQKSNSLPKSPYQYSFHDCILVRPEDLYTLKNIKPTYIS